jgi:hypothetical protein
MPELPITRRHALVAAAVLAAVLFVGGRARQFRSSRSRRRR